MAQTMIKRAFQNEKTDLLGELAIRLGNSKLRDEREGMYPPPPPVFQTYAKQLSGDSRDHEVTSVKAPGPPPPPVRGRDKHLPQKERSTGDHLYVPSPTTLSKSKESPPAVVAPTRHSHKRCNGCEQPVITGGGYANGKLYHQECFKCSDCHVKLVEKFSSAQGRFLCQDCYKNYVKFCDLCSKTITDNCIESVGKFYHESCMKCYECQVLLSGYYFILMGKFFCEKDYNRLKKTCAECGETISGVYYTGEDNTTLCETHYKKMLGKCKRCGGLLEGSIIKIDGGKFHSACFTCKICEVSLKDSSVLTDDDREIYCQFCHDKLFAAKCAKCKLPIVPDKDQTSVQTLKALDKTFHLDCFTCETCGLVLQDGCYPIGNKPFCFDCYEDKRHI